MKKHIHKIIINAQKKYKRSYTYDFGHTKDIRIELSNNSICITAMLKKIYDKSEMLSQGCYLFPDAIKKALTLHLLLFSENITIRKLSVQIDDEFDTVIDIAQGQASPIYSMIEKKLYHKIKQSWSVEEIGGFLKLTKSSDDSRLAAMNAFIISKSKSFETERFIYLWTAFNAMYNYYVNIVSEISKTNYRKDIKKLELFLKLNNLGNECIAENDKTIIAHEVVSIISRLYNGKITYASFSHGKYSNILSEIKRKLINRNEQRCYDITPYGYLLMQFSYYFRCNIIHGSKPYALFSYEEESEIKCLRCINELLEEFLEENLHEWFNSSQIEYLKEKATQIK